MSNEVQVPFNEHLKYWISNHPVWFGANGAASGYKVLFSSIGTITDTPWIGRLTERNLVSFGSLYSRTIVLTRLSLPTLTSFTLPNLYVERVSLRYLIKQMSPTFTFLCLWSHLYDGTSEGKTDWYQFSHHWSTSSWRKRNLLVVLLDFSWSNGPWGTSADALPKIRWFGVMGEGHAGSDPLMIPIGRLLIMLAISKSTVWSWPNVRMFPVILCWMERFVNFTNDSLRPFWCWPSAGATVHLILFVEAHRCMGSQSQLATNCAMSSAAAMSWDPWSDWISPRHFPL